MEYFVTQMVVLFAESLGKVLGLILPIGLIYGKLLKKYSWVTIGAAIPIAAILDAIVTPTLGADNPHILLIGSGACLAGIEIASLFIKPKKRPDAAA